MKAMKTVGVKELKNNLSAYLRLIHAGYVILITDRNQVVAEMREPLAAGPLLSSNPLLTLWTQEGKIKSPAQNKKWVYPSSHLKTKEGTALRLLNEDRDE